jgi:RNA polymerase sigma-70 factor (ECF subfamily)
MEIDLVVRAQAGDDAAFRALSASVTPRSLRVAYGILRDPALAEDATQQALVRIWRQLPRLRDPSRFEAWSMRILVNACRTQARDSRRWSLSLPSIREPVATEQLANVLDRDQLERAFRRLPVGQRAVLVLHLYVGFGNAETAAILGIPEGTVRSRLHQGLRAMRASIAADDRASPGLVSPEGTSR